MALLLCRCAAGSCARASRRERERERPPPSARRLSYLPWDRAQAERAASKRSSSQSCDRRCCRGTRDFVREKEIDR